MYLARLLVLENERKITYFSCSDDAASDATDRLRNLQDSNVDEHGFGVKNGFRTG